MIYPRKTTLDGKETLVTDEHMVGAREHLSSNYRIINVIGEIGWELESTNLLLAMDSFNHEPIKLIISSPGGSLDALFLLCDVFKLIESPIITIGTFCCSAAAILLAAGTKRYVLPHAKVMLHLPQSRMGWADPKEWEIANMEMQKNKQKMIDLLLEYGVKKPEEELLRDIDREFWMGAEETIAYGLADEIITKEEVQSWFRGG